MGTTIHPTSAEAGSTIYLSTAYMSNVQKCILSGGRPIQFHVHVTQLFLLQILCNTTSPNMP